ncbi:hypothetical protein OSB04_003533 [Centaurea solstitialis]|uniref:ACB domain-containing protein n=1 Tax=Centaurea solstitialis TaxID=347529 RepID=A0AA38UC82_9ASTR|nr:hypothetical protein OSB04_003533 [Centaurea solstitialis]
MLFTAIAAFLLFILITRIAFTVINGDHDRRRTNHDDFSKVINPKKTEKTSSSSSKRKGKKKVRFAVDHDDEFVVNKVVAGPSETAKLVVFEKDQYDEKELISLNDVVDCDQAEEEAKIESISEENVGNHDHDDDDGGGLIGVKLVCDDDGVDEELKEKEGLISDEDDDSDDWEGVERSDLEKVFAMAAEFGKVDDNLGDLESDVQMQLYGLHKVATEGPCYEAQPMALKVSARAKWYHSTFILISTLCYNLLE